ncbi:MAG TPA: ankyrin repeat domain-containing protein [Spirochaetota bacterium]|nr:ankyrin repeat domain-containing protein [Spirochaetota bacterium]HPI87816.1 ankyrin repeat domain-containing protein [Spirochaetota bacterium]HPR47543.1 ankyrin repeat domain-containing protein [Spirochaetota bacterium]
MTRYLKALLLLAILLTLTTTGCDTLSSAAYNGKYEVAQQLIAKGHDVNGYDKWGWTPLMWAAYYNQYTIARLLLEKGADPNIQSIKEYKSLKKGTTPFMVAAYSGNTVIIREMLKYKGNPELEDSQGNSASTYAEQYHGQEVIKVVKGKN